jgi:hypothetical protein
VLGALIGAMFVVNLAAIAGDPIPPCVRMVDMWTDGSCTDCDFCWVETSYYLYWCPKNGVCPVGWQCKYLDTERAIVMIEYGCIDDCFDPNDPHCSYDAGDVTVIYDDVPERSDCVRPV